MQSSDPLASSEESLLKHLSANSYQSSYQHGLPLGLNGHLNHSKPSTQAVTEKAQSMKRKWYPSYCDMF